MPATTSHRPISSAWSPASSPRSRASSASVQTDPRPATGRSWPADTRNAPTTGSRGQPHPAAGSVTGVFGEPLGSPAFTYAYQDGDGIWIPTGNGGADDPAEPGYDKAVASFAGTA